MTISIFVAKKMVQKKSGKNVRQLASTTIFKTPPFTRCLGVLATVKHWRHHDLSSAIHPRNRVHLHLNLNRRRVCRPVDGGLCLDRFRCRFFWGAQLVGGWVPQPIWTNIFAQYPKMGKISSPKGSGWTLGCGDGNFLQCWPELMFWTWHKLTKSDYVCDMKPMINWNSKKNEKWQQKSSTTRWFNSWPLDPLGSWRSPTTFGRVTFSPWQKRHQKNPQLQDFSNETARKTCRFGPPNCLRDWPPTREQRRPRLVGPLFGGSAGPKFLIPKKSSLKNIFGCFQK